jgi:DNA/RNA endonuclease G (NUC1)
VWKLVIVESGGNLHAAFLAPQTETKAARLFEYQVMISELESATGLQFFPEFGALPQDFKSEVDPLFFQN